MTADGVQTPTPVPLLQQRVRWCKDMEWLYCWGSISSADPGKYVYEWCGGLFDLAYRYAKSTGHVSNKISGIKFWCLQGQLATSDTLLAQQDTLGNIPALAIFNDLIERRRGLGAEGEVILKPIGTDRLKRHIELAREFLTSEQILVPESEWRQALPQYVA